MHTSKGVASGREVWGRIRVRGLNAQRPPVAVQQRCSLRGMIDTDPKLNESHKSPADYISRRAPLRNVTPEISGSGYAQPNQNPWTSHETRMKNGNAGQLRRVHSIFHQFISISINISISIATHKRRGIILSRPAARLRFTAATACSDRQPATRTLLRHTPAAGHDGRTAARAEGEPRDASGRLSFVPYPAL